MWATVLFLSHAFMFTGLEKGLSDFFTKSDVKAYKEFTGENLHGNMYEPPAGIFV